MRDGRVRKRFRRVANRLDRGRIGQGRTSCHVEVLDRRDTDMRLGSTFKIAFRALRRNKLRSALTALGIIIGVGAVIAMVEHRQRRQGAGRSADREPRRKRDSDLLRQHDRERHSHRLGRRGHAEDRGCRSHPARSAGGHRGQRRSAFRPRKSRREIRTGSRAFSASRRNISTCGNGPWPMARLSPIRTCAARTRSASSARRRRRRFSGTKIPSARSCASRTSRSPSPACSLRKA